MTGAISEPQDDNNRNLPLSRIRHRANASVVELVCWRLPHACRPTPHGAIYAEYLCTPDGRGSGRGQARHRPRPRQSAPSKGTSAGIASCFIRRFGLAEIPDVPRHAAEPPFWEAPVSTEFRASFGFVAATSQQRRVLMLVRWSPDASSLGPGHPERPGASFYRRNPARRQESRVSLSGDDC